MDGLARLPATIAVIRLGQVGNHHERIRRQPADPLDGAVHAFAFLRSREIVDAAGPGDRPVTASQDAEPQPRGLLGNDGDVIAALKQLEGLSVQIILRIATDDNVVIEYWNKVNVSIDINVLVLDEFECEGSQIEEVNGWLTYGAALHRAREYGVVVPFMDNVDYCQLSQADIKSVVQML